MQNIPENLAYLLEDETKAYGVLATIMPDGSPQVTPLWFNTDGEHILINTAKGRVKDKNMRARPQVAMIIMDVKNPDHYLQIRGKVVEVTEEGAVDHIHALSTKYHGHPFDLPKDHVRVIYKIKPN